MTNETRTVMDSVDKEDAVDTEEPKQEEKLASIMEAANALTALADEDEAAAATDGLPVATTVSPNVNAKVIGDPQTVDTPTEVDPPSTPVVVAAAAKLDESRVKQEATPTTATAPVVPVLPQEDGTVASSNSCGTGTTGANGGASNDSSRRYLPEHKKPDAAPTFPEKMMAMMRSVDEHRDDPNYCAAWLPEGKSFVVRHPDEFARKIVPKYFKATKFSSFTRKLYRWGFRQINRGIGPDDPVIFGNEFFERDNEALMSQMRSITAAGTRKSESRMGDTNTGSHQPNNMYGKRSFDGNFHNNMYDPFAEQQKRYLYEQFMHQQKNAQMMHQQHYGGMTTNGPMHMNHHSMNGGSGTHPAMETGYPAPHHVIPPMNSKPYDMMHPMHPDGHPMMMNMAYNPMQQHQQQSQQHHSSPQQMKQSGAMMPSNLGSPMQTLAGNTMQQHSGQSLVGAGMSSGSGSNSMIQPSPPQQSQQQNGVGGDNGGTGPGQGGHSGDVVGHNGDGNTGPENQDTAGIVNAAIRALHYPA